MTTPEKPAAAPRRSPAVEMQAEGESNQSPQRTAWHARLDARTRALLEEDAEVFLHQSVSSPCLDALSSAAGSHLTNVEGKRYLDFHGNSVHQVGFGHPHVIAAVVAQLEQLAFCPRRFTNRPAVALARRLTALAPGDLDKVLFAPGGTSAIGMALKLARAVTGRFKTLSMWDAFHGASLDAISIGGEAMFRKDAGPLLPGTEHAPPPDPRRCPWACGDTCNLKCAEYVDYVLAKEGDIGAVIAETVRSTPFIPPPDYWRLVREACDRHGALLILDEVPTCLGRTGRMFACEHYAIVPDMLVIGKGLGGGVFPLAALIARKHLDVAGDRALGHYTHEKSPVGCAAALAALEVIEREGLVERARTLGAYALDALLQLRERHACIRDVRGIGLLLGVEIVDGQTSGGPASELAEKVLYAALERGLSFKIFMGNVLNLAPPLNVSRSDLDAAVECLDASLTAVSSGA